MTNRNTPIYILHNSFTVKWEYARIKHIGSSIFSVNEVFIVKKEIFSLKQGINPHFFMLFSCLYPFYYNPFHYILLRMHISLVSALFLIVSKLIKTTL